MHAGAEARESVSEAEKTLRELRIEDGCDASQTSTGEISAPRAVHDINVPLLSHLEEAEDLAGFDRFIYEQSPMRAQG